MVEYGAEDGAVLLVVRLRHLQEGKRKRNIQLHLKFQVRIIAHVRQGHHILVQRHTIQLAAGEYQHQLMRSAAVNARIEHWTFRQYLQNV